MDSLPSQGYYSEEKHKHPHPCREHEIKGYMMD